MSDLLDQPPLQPIELVRLQDSIARLLGTHDDVVIMQAEAIATLEAVARAVAHPEATVVNVVTGPYGRMFGSWMRASGAIVVDVSSGYDRVIDPEAVRAALAANPAVSVVAMVHAEAATGGTNPVRDVARLAKEHGALVVLDAVASIGAEPVTPTEWGIDVTVIGGQKALAGPAGVSAVAIGESAWRSIETNPSAPRRSFLSLLDARDAFNRTDHSSVPGTPNTLDVRGLLEAIERVRAEGLGTVQERHARASAAVRRALTVLGLATWQRGPDGFAPVVTTLRRDPKIDVSLALGGLVTLGAGSLSADVLRIDHTGRAADERAVAGAIEQLAVSIGAAAETERAAIEAAHDAWSSR